MVASAPEPAEVPLLVVGGGPTGIAALFQARLEGIEAVGLEAGPGPTTSIREYLNGLVLISRPTDYEIAGIPLDTRDPNQLTREEVLHYLGRIVNYGDLDFRYQAPAQELAPLDGRVLVRTPGRDWLADHVVVTAWYRRRRPPPELVNASTRGAPQGAGSTRGAPQGAGSARGAPQGAASGGVEVIETLHDPIAVAGRRPVIVGGGMSAFEHATAVMMHGQSVTIVARHRLPRAFRTPHFETLVRDAGSRIVEGDGAGAGEGRLAYRGGDDAGFVACDVLIPLPRSRTGPRRPRDALAGRGGDRAGDRSGHGVADAGHDDPPWPQRPRGHPGRAWRLARFANPPGRRGQRDPPCRRRPAHRRGPLGVRVSINTAVVAVRDIAGHQPPDYMAVGPLPMALARWVQLPPPEASWSLLAAIRPLRIAAWTRTNMAMRSRDSFEASPQPVAAGSPFLLAPEARGSWLDQVLAMADGSTSVGEMAGRLMISDDRGRMGLTRLLRYLWWNNALTWLPPAEGSPFD